MNIDYVLGRGHGYIGGLCVICTWCRRDFGNIWVLEFGLFVHAGNYTIHLG